MTGVVDTAVMGLYGDKADLAAVAVAAAIGAERCDIYTDVDGVYTTDPRIVARAKKQEFVTYEEMLELASVGAKVLTERVCSTLAPRLASSSISSKAIFSSFRAFDVMRGSVV